MTSIYIIEDDDCYCYYITSEKHVTFFNCTARNEELGKQAVENLKTEGLNPSFHQLDILSSESIQRLKDYLEKTFGGLDLLINNAGIAYKVRLILYH
jgi:NAD(P)-dependent dehydrogenase (short-subunit alcohol dehydrogenase family)